MYVDIKYPLPKPNNRAKRGRVSGIYPTTNRATVLKRVRPISNNHPIKTRGYKALLPTPGVSRFAVGRGDSKAIRLRPTRRNSYDFCKWTNGHGTGVSSLLFWRGIHSQKICVVPPPGTRTVRMTPQNLTPQHYTTTYPPYMALL